LLAADLLEDSLEPWLRGDIEPQAQPNDGATTTRPLRRDDGRLDPRRSAADLERQVRAYQPWPGSFAETPEGRLIVWRASAAPDGPKPGTFDLDGLGTEGGRLRLIEVQPAGGRRMSWDDYVRGRPSIVGASIVG
jgi:methionyl-tRNA formyltransferase